MSYISGYGGIGGRALLIVISEVCEGIGDRGLLMVMHELYDWIWGNMGSMVANGD